MNDSRVHTIQDIIQYLNGNNAIEFKASDRQSSYDWIRKTLVNFRYLHVSKQEKTIIKTYLKKMTGYSNPQITRLIRQFKKTGRIVRQAPSGHKW